jgi:hypothetical protein
VRRRGDVVATYCLETQKHGGLLTSDPRTPNFMGATLARTNFEPAKYLFWRKYFGFCKGFFGFSSFFDILISFAALKTAEEVATSILVS